MIIEHESIRMDPSNAKIYEFGVAINLAAFKKYPIRRSRELRERETRERESKLELLSQRADQKLDLFTGEVPGNMIHPVEL